VVKAAAPGSGFDRRVRVGGRPLTGREALTEPLMRARRVDVGLVLANQGRELPIGEYQHVVE
jgi:hypothetical protein